MNAFVTKVNFREAISREHTREHAEWLTRMTARAIGVNDAQWRWSPAHGGIIRMGFAEAGERKIFAPLNDMADAFEVESRLRMNAHYRWLSTERHAIYMSLAHDKSKCDLWAMINDGDDVFRVRMNAVCQLAAMRQAEINDEAG